MADEVLQEEESILCFEHCKARNRIFCFQFPLTCPLCHETLATSPLIMPPFRVPSPFSCLPYSIVIKPSTGTFIRDYRNTEDLHIGITDSQGNVYDYNEVGVNTGRSGWNQCLSIQLDGAICWHDEKLKTFSELPQWKSFRYHSNKHNCYDFVLQFLQQLGPELPLSSMVDKVTFCEDIIVPNTKRVAKYVTLYRTLLADNIYVEKAESS